MIPWQWLLAGLAVWCVLSVCLGLLIGPVLRRSREAMEALDQHVILDMDVQPSQE
jgi:hypothetical protein